MQIFDEIKTRGVEDILFISMDGVSGLEEGAKSIFKNVVVPRCMGKKLETCNENALLKLLYLRVTELYKKWKDKPISNWVMVRNQIAINPEMQARITKYENI